ncbi:hypothetical protein HZB94_02650 [Candidatus Falkowbacteria bacterium]|nr:hypothetical protein [Candidatus Falkowbacteria bacterium]
MREEDKKEFPADEPEIQPDVNVEKGFGATRFAQSNPVDDFNVYQREKRKQIIALTGVAVIGIGIVIIGFWQLKNNLTLPWPAAPKDSGTAVSASQVIEKMDISDEDPAVLKQKDSDGDKISDFDEYYIYGTSAYLADSDSDGVSDFDEIQNSEDPNCEKGKQCFRTGEFVEAGLSEGTKTESSPKSSLLNIDADTLRKLLAQSGKISEDQLKIISDADLIEMYKQMLAENPDLVKKFEAQANEDKSSAPTEGSVTIVDIKKMLLSQGISESELNAFGDAELTKMYQAAFEKVKTEEQNK